MSEKNLGEHGPEVYICAAFQIVALLLCLYIVAEVSQLRRAARPCGRDAREAVSLAGADSAVRDASDGTSCAARHWPPSLCVRLAPCQRLLGLPCIHQGTAGKPSLLGSPRKMAASMGEDGVP